MTSRARHIRVCLVGTVFAIVTVALWGRLIQVQYVRHDAYVAEAVRQRVAPREVAPVRGAIFDREGRPLALSARKPSVAVVPKKIRNERVVVAELARALDMSSNAVRRRVRRADSFVYVRRHAELSEEESDRLSSLPGVVVEYEAGRVYPYDAIASKVVGTVGYDNRGVSGVEAAYERELCGEPGRERVVRNGSYQSERYHRFIEKRPEDGRHIYLTIDAVVQEIAESELRRAVRSFGAESGCVIVMEVETGEILALAETPAVTSRRGTHAADSLWTLRSLSHVYEPGSTFKVVTAAALLESGKVAPADSFDAENGRADLGYALIRDPHPHGRVTFEEAVMYSSNVVFAKAARLVEAEDFYHHIRLFGFGEKTGVRLLGESAGSVPEIADWSLRTQSTLAFGQEIAVTPLQMINAVAAIANDGVMMMPQIVRGVGDASSGDVRKLKPVKIRRVISRETAQTLRAFCYNVVANGTGTEASVDMVTVAGKTGTAQKASARGGYKAHKYVSSFVGFAPYEDPRVVCLVLLDEPRWASRYGGDSAAPTFARIMTEIANSTSIFDDALVAEAVSPAPIDEGDFHAPNFLRMERSAALEYARALRANVLCKGEGGRVVAQHPNPGVVLDRDAVIRLVVSDGNATDARTPDLRGMSMRGAKLTAVRNGFRAQFVGAGTVRSQSPAPGTRTSYHVVRLICDGGSGGAGGSR